MGNNSPHNRPGINWGIIAGLSVLVLIMPWILTQVCWSDCLNFSNTGQIGDTVGGLTAPFIGLMNIAFLFITFKSQQQFNHRQLEFNEAQCRASDLQLALHVRDHIAKRCDSMPVKLLEYAREGFEHKTREYIGSDSLDLLREIKAGRSKYHIEFNNYKVLYHESEQIVSLYALLSKLLCSSSLSSEVIGTMHGSIYDNKIAAVCRFLEQSENQKVPIYPSRDDEAKVIASQASVLIQKLGEAHQQLLACASH